MQKHFKIEKDILAIRKDAEQEENFAKLDTLFNLSNYNHSSLVDFSSTYHDYLSKFIYKGLVPATAVKQTDLMFKWLGIAGKQFKVEVKDYKHERIYTFYHKAVKGCSEQIFDFMSMLLALLDLDWMYTYNQDSEIDTPACITHVSVPNEEGLRSRIGTTLSHGTDGKLAISNFNYLDVKP